MANMKAVYRLRNKLARDPEYVRRTQALTLDAKEPMGLKGTHGLYGSEVWWRNVESGAIRQEHYTGVIRRLYGAGQDQGDEPNAFEIESNEGKKYDWSIVVNDEADRSLYQVGRWVEVVTVFLELKRPQPDGSPDFHERPLQILISTDSAG